jgi:hypothetical protein
VTLDAILNTVAISCWILGAILALVVVIADLIPGERRATPAYDGQVTWIEPPTGSIPVVRTPPADIEIDVVARTLGRGSDVGAFIRREVRRQLLASSAETKPTPVARGEQGGAR